MPRGGLVLLRPGHLRATRASDFPSRQFSAFEEDENVFMRFCSPRSLSPRFSLHHSRHLRHMRATERNRVDNTAFGWRHTHDSRHFDSFLCVTKALAVVPRLCSRFRWLRWKLMRNVQLQVALGQRLVSELLTASDRSFDVESARTVSFDHLAAGESWACGACVGVARGWDLDVR